MPPWARAVAAREQRARQREGESMLVKYRIGLPLLRGYGLNRCIYRYMYTRDAKHDVANRSWTQCKMDVLNSFPTI